jgi:hypothetical protein
MNETLTELLPRTVRLWLYVLGGAVTAGVAAWQAADGNWAVFAASIAATLTQWLAARNINPPVVTVEPEPAPLVTQTEPEPEVQPPSADDLERRRFLDDYGSQL